MANEPLARAFSPPDAPDEDGFLTLRAALSASARGRAFLAEYLRRNRYADTEAVLEAIARIETRLHADASAVERTRGDLRLLLKAVRLTRPKIDAAGPAARAAKLSQLLDLFERRIEAMAPTPDEATAEGSAVAGRLHLAVVPQPDEPELPIPSPASAPAPAMVLVPNAASAPAPAVAERVPSAVVETVVAPPRDPLAALMALSEDERLALFT
jgi:hypothetical protein